MFWDYLLEFKKTCEFVAVYFNSDKFFFGSICGVDEEFVVIQSYTPYGDNDGYVIKRIDEITRVERNSKYIEKLKKIIIAKDTVHSNMRFENDSIVETVLEKSLKEKKVVSIELESSDSLVVGNVKLVEYPICVIDQINEYGEFDGELIFAIQHINSLYFDTMDETNINLLHQSQLGGSSLIDK